MVLKRRFLFFVFLIGFSSLIFGQTTVVEIDINGRQIIEQIPFDEYFTFKSIKTEYDKIEFTYKIVDELEDKCHNNGSKKYYFCGMDQYISLFIDPVDKKVSFPNDLGPIHPNTKYLFKFKRIKYVKFTDVEEEKKFKNEVLAIINKNLYIDFNTNKITFNHNNIEIKIFKLIKKYSKVNSSIKLIGKDGKEYTEKTLFSKWSLGDFIRRIDGEYEVVIKALKNIPAHQKFLLSNLDKNSISQKIYLLTISQERKIHLFLNATSIGSIDAKTDKTLKELIVLLFKNQKNIKDIINGKLKILEGKLEKLNQIEGHETKMPDEISLVIIKKVFESVRTQISDEEDKKLIEKIIANLNNIKNRIKVIKKANKEIESIIDKVPNILEGAFLKDEFQLSHNVSIPIESMKDIYYGLDVGFSYALGINTLFTYQGLNIYLAPINRKTPLSLYKGNDRWLKRISIYLGIAQTLSSAPIKYEPLFSGNSLIVGAGWRFNRAMRINIGGLIYKEKDLNPLISKTTVTVFPTISLTVDVDLAAGLGTIGEVFNLK